MYKEKVLLIDNDGCIVFANEKMKQKEKGRKTAALCWNFQNRENKQPFYYLNLEAANKI